MSQAKDKFPSEKILETVEQYRIDVRDFSKYLITLAVTIIPLMIGIAGFLLKDEGLIGFPLGFLITGLMFIFITIPLNLSLYLPTYKPWSGETYDLTIKLVQKNKSKSIYYMIILVLGMFFTFIGILLIVII